MGFRPIFFVFSWVVIGFERDLRKSESNAQNGSNCNCNADNDSSNNESNGDIGVKTKARLIADMTVSAMRELQCLRSVVWKVLTCFGDT